MYSGSYGEILSQEMSESFVCDAFAIVEFFSTVKNTGKKTWQ